MKKYVSSTAGVKPAAGSAKVVSVTGGTGRGAPNGNSWKKNDSPSKPFAATAGSKGRSGKNM